MKRKNTLWSLVLALVMVLGVFAPLGALAAQQGDAAKAQGTKTVTLHKMKITKDALKPRQVKVNIAKEGEKENFVTRIIVAKVENEVTNYYDEKNNKLDPNDETDAKYIEAYPNSKPAFPGTIGLDGTAYDGKAIGDKAAYFGQDEEMANVYFAWQKQIDGQWKYINAKGEAAKIQDPKDANFTSETKNDVLGGLTEATGKEFKTDQLPAGTYKIVEIKELSKYKTEAGEVIANQKAVPVDITLPLLNSDGVVENAHVYPKNVVDKPEIDKNFAKEHGLKKLVDEKNNIDVGAVYENYKEKKAKASGDVDQIIPYEVKTKIDADTSYERLIWNDIMTNGLTFNQDLKIEATNGVTFEAADYELVQDANGFRLKMNDSGLTKISNVTLAEKDAKDVEITLTYSATINDSAVVDEPEKNNVKLEYGHKKGDDHKKKEVTPQEGKLKVNKNFSDGAKTTGLKIVYTLWQNNKVVASIALDDTMVNTDPKNIKSYQLTDKIKFTPGEKAFNGTFEGLEGEGWEISERVAGFNPAYAETNAAGTVTITNNEDKDNPTPLEPETPEVVVGGKKFVKIDNTNKRLEGAEFVVKNEQGDKYLAKKDDAKVQEQKAKVDETKTALDKAVKDYNTRPNDDNEAKLKEAVDKAQKAYNAAFAEYSKPYEWVDKTKETEARIVKLTSDEQGRFAFEGFVYGKYNLEETKAPKGFAKLTSLVPFEVKAGSFKDVEVDFKYNENDAANSAKSIENKLVTIPETGGMGTVLFMVAGLALMGGAFIAMRKRSAEQA